MCVCVCKVTCAIARVWPTLYGAQICTPGDEPLMTARCGSEPYMAPEATPSLHGSQTGDAMRNGRV